MKTRLPDCLKVPVYYDDDLLPISYSMGFWRWKRILVGPQWAQLTPREQGAVLLHEAGHCKLRHHEKRLARFWLIVSPRRLFAYWHQQEYEADRFAAACGYGVDLASMFLKLRRKDAGGIARKLHPDINSRISRLLGPQGG